MRDFKLVAEPTCTAPGYAVNTGPPILAESFGGAALPAGWSVPFTGFGGWLFDDPGARGNLTGGAGAFAILDSDLLGPGTAEDASLVTPPVNLTGAVAPELRFNSDYRALPGSTGDVDIKLNAAVPYVTRLHQGDVSVRGPRVETIPIREAVGEPAVSIRFRYVGTWDWWWQVDDVTIVDRCTRVPGGLVFGTVSDKATGRAIDGAIVASPPGAAVTTVPTPDDPAVGDGFYALATPLTGPRAFTATADRYLGATRDVDVVANGVVRQDFALDPVPANLPSPPEPAVKAWIALERGAALGGLTVTPQDVVAIRQDDSVRMLFDGSAAGLPGAAAIDALAVTGDGLGALVHEAGAAAGDRGDGRRFRLRPVHRRRVHAVSRRQRRRAARRGRGRRCGRAARRREDPRVDGRPRTRRPAAGAGRGSPRVHPEAPGRADRGRWRLFLDGSDIDLSGRGEDVDAAAVDATGAIDLSVRGSLSVPALRAADDDVAVFFPAHLGGRTAGRFAPRPLLGGAALGLRADDVTAVDVPD